MLSTPMQVEGAKSDVYDELLFPFRRVLIDGVVLELSKRGSTNASQLVYITTRRNGAVALILTFLVVVIGAFGILIAGV
jgi:hypothetical protein